MATTNLCIAKLEKEANDAETELSPYLVSILSKMYFEIIHFETFYYNFFFNFSQKCFLVKIWVGSETPNI